MEKGKVINSLIEFYTSLTFCFNSINNFISNFNKFANILIYQRIEFVIKNFGILKEFRYRNRLYFFDCINEFLPISYNPYKIQDFFIDIN